MRRLQVRCSSSDCLQKRKCILDLRPQGQILPCAFLRKSNTICRKVTVYADEFFAGKSQQVFLNIQMPGGYNVCAVTFL